MTTIKIKPSHPSQGEFVLIEKIDFNPDVHELYGDQDLGAPTERVPTMADLLAAHDDLQQREHELAAEKERVAKQAQENELAAARNGEQAAANEAEAQRLRDEAAKLAAATQAAAAESKPAKAKTT